MNVLYDLIKHKPVKYCDYILPSSLQNQHFEVLQTVEGLFEDVRHMAGSLSLPATSMHSAIERRKKEEQLLLTCEDIEATMRDVGLKAEYDLITIEKTSYCAGDSFSDETALVHGLAVKIQSDIGPERV